ncbi:hypothetical protein SKAU_G00094830 [Synaphobranchus kaupii]|uniref:Uncharacterized protein n=1 Tax=Synaphobranchus kaupii TaxID=118154 RepID=A0A9Q1FXE0_SYNKA|nr:hypothetical protein SKAU_G00094830 [Synaphobranchus kaupii]
MVLGRTIHQCKQMHKGLKEVGLWPLVNRRPDVVAQLFPNPESCTAQMLLQRIVWPQSEGVHYVDDDREEFAVDTRCCITSYLRQFIENDQVTIFSIVKRDKKQAEGVIFRCHEAAAY